MLGDETRVDFPILERKVADRRLVYLDNAAMMQMPRQVLDAVVEHETMRRANVHRGIHTLSEEATASLEDARKTVQGFIGAPEPECVLFTSGTTGSANAVASGLARRILQPDDEVVTTVMEHHSNFCPWQVACEETGAKFRVVPLLESGDLDLDKLATTLGPRTRLVAVTAVSNVTGAVNPLNRIVEMVRSICGPGCAIFIDAAQAMRHGRMDVSALDCDFLAFSGHKIGAPEGIGILYGKREWLERISPWQLGGGMVDRVSVESTAYGELPFRMEAGTPNVAGAVGLGAGIRYLQGIGLDRIYGYEADLLARIEDVLRGFDRIHVYGEPAERSGCVSFGFARLAPYDVATLLDKLGVAVRSGHHCAQPLMSALGVTGTVRVSPAFYNTESDVEALASALARIDAIDGKL